MADDRPSTAPAVSANARDEATDPQSRNRSRDAQRGGDRAPHDRPMPDFDESPMHRAETALWRSWSNLWQIPTIVVCSLLITAGILLAVHNRPRNDFDGVLDQVDRLIENGRLDVALGQLRDVVEPNLDLALPLQRAEYHALVADWVYAAQSDQRQKTLANHQRIDQQYTEAVTGGLVLGPARIERWAETLILMGDLDRARERLAQLDAIDVSEGGVVSVRDRRNHIFRMLIEHSLNAPEADEPAMLALLADYLKDDRLSLGDRAWAIGQQAAIRIEAARPREAIDHLLVDMRRLEQRADASADGDTVDFGVLYTLLGRGYYDLGEYDTAAAHLQQALSRLGEQQPERGDALALLGRLAFAQTDYDAAYDDFDQVVREYVGTRSFLPGLLGRAEVRSVLGDHSGSQEDYRSLHDQLALEPPRRDVNAVRIAESLRDRHDAALASRRLDLALDYALIAETFFSPSDVPAAILLRIASTSRALGEQLLASIDESAVGTDDPDAAIDLEVRKLANIHFKRAGDYAIRHARMLAMRPDSDEEWADSLWLGADAYDRGGWYDLAISHFEEYVGSRPTDDPRHAEALFRLGQAYHAQLEFEKAADAYGKVIADHPRSQFASASYVPLARCLRRLDRTAEAEQQLRQVVSGKLSLDPDAVDFRNALVELGDLYLQDEQYAEAVETLQEAAARYPDDAHRNEILFHLGDAFRGGAMQLDDQLSDKIRLAPSERERLRKLRDGQFQQAIQRYAAVCENLERTDTDRHGRPRLEEDMLRQGYLYQADCLFHLADYAAAIEMYDFAARKYSMHHSSMYALVQIVNCYSEMGMLDRAQAAHHRALVRLEQLPPDTFDAPDSVMDRQAWERWLANSPVAPDRTASAMAPP